MKKIGILVGSNTDLEALSIRQSLEYFGYEVYMKYVGRPNDFRDFLQGKLFSNEIDFFILCFHGINGGFIMPKLSREIYTADEVKNKFGFKDIEENILLKKKVFLSTACSVGKKNMANSFIKNKSIFIAPKGYIEGNSAYVFVINFFYNFFENQDIEGSFEKAMNIDAETQQFKLFRVLK